MKTNDTFDYYNKNAQKFVEETVDVVEDGHPILIVTASDIAGILRNNAIDTSNIKDWICTIDHSTNRLEAYYYRFNEYLRN